MFWIFYLLEKGEEMIMYQITVILILAAFYVFYFAKIVLQKK